MNRKSTISSTVQTSIFFSLQYEMLWSDTSTRWKQHTLEKSKRKMRYTASLSHKPGKHHELELVFAEF